MTEPGRTPSPEKRPYVASDEERAWNEAHGLTATCPVCGGAMKDDGREACSFACHHRLSRESGHG